MANRSPLWFYRSADQQSESTWGPAAPRAGQWILAVALDAFVRPKGEKCAWNTELSSTHAGGLEAATKAFSGPRKPTSRSLIKRLPQGGPLSHGYYDGSEYFLRLQFRSTCCCEDHCVRAMKARRPDLALLAFSNAYAIGGFLLASSLLLAPLSLTETRPVWISVPIAALAMVLWYFAWLSHRERLLRRRIYRIFERRIIRKGFRQEHFRHLCGGACLRFQHHLLFLRYGVHGTVLLDHASI